MSNESSLLKELLELEFANENEGSEYYDVLKDHIFRNLGFKVDGKVLEEILSYKDKLNFGINTDVLLCSNESCGKVIVLVEYKRIFNNEFNLHVKLTCKQMFLPKNISWNKDEVNHIVELVLDERIDRMEIEKFKRKRGNNAGFWLHKNGNGLGQILN